MTNEAKALLLASNRLLLGRRLSAARAVLFSNLRKAFGPEGRFDFDGKRILGNNGLVLQWQTRYKPDEPESYYNQQTNVGIVICVRT